MSKRSDYRYFERLRVRWSEIDAQKIVFNGHYLTYFDTAMAGYWRALATPYAETMAQLGGDLFVRKATVEYLASARYDDLLDIGLRCERVGNSSLLFHAAAFRQDRLIVTGELVYVFADPLTQTSRAVPQALRDALTAFEARKSMVKVQVGSWAQLKEPAARIRKQVFVEEQQIPVELEWDDADEGNVHAVAFNRFGLPLATGRLVAYAPGVARIGRMAVSQTLRGSGIGQRVLDALLHAAKERGDLQAVLHAQTSAIPFYLRAGFVQNGPEFDEAGIAHVEMTKAL